MKLSIITPSLNQGRFIRDTIDSVLSQNYENFEHIVIDGGSVDETLEILKNYPHLKWISEKDSGAANAINKGFSLATGDIFAWINADDFYEKNVFLIIDKMFSSKIDLNFLYGNLTYINQDKVVIRKESNVIFDYYDLVHNRPDNIRQPCSFFRRTLFEEVGGINESLKLVFDYELFLRMILLTEPRYVNINFAYYRDHEDTLTRKSKRRQALELWKVSRKHGAKISDPIFKKLLRQIFYT